ncbi:MAG: hypothetical protein QM756_04175 [Polyangiaceae bacterium]
MSTIAPPIRAILDVFETKLADVRFADIDKARLNGLAADVESAAAELAEYEAGAARLRTALAERQELLLQQAQRALAFARIYAENDPELTAALDPISLPRGPKKPKAEAAPKAASTPVAAPPPAPVVEAEAVAEPEEAPSAAPARRGKRREAARVVARDDEGFDAPGADA